MVVRAFVVGRVFWLVARWMLGCFGWLLQVFLPILLSIRRLYMIHLSLSLPVCNMHFLMKALEVTVS